MCSVLAGCSIGQLEDNTVDVGGSIGPIYTSQVLQNVESLIDDPNAVPSHFLLRDGSIKTSNALTPSVSVPIGNQVTTNSQGAVVEAVTNYKGVGITGAQEWEQSWSIEPEQDPLALRRLRSLYRYVLGQIDQDQFRSQFAPPGAAVRAVPDDGLPDFIASVEACPRDAGDRPQCLRRSDFAESCRGGPDRVPTTTRAGVDWVCLGRFGSILDRRLRRQTLLIDKPAYDRGMIFDLVTIALQVQHEALPAGSKPEHH